MIVSIPDLCPLTYSDVSFKQHAHELLDKCLGKSVVQFNIFVKSLGSTMICLCDFSLLIICLYLLFLYLYIFVQSIIPL